MNRKKPKKSDNVLWRLCRKAVLLLLIIGIPFLFFTSTFQLKKIDVVGNERYTKEQITEQLLQSKLDSYTPILYMKYRYFTLFHYPFVEKIDMEMVDNHTITVYVYEKQVAGCVEFMGEYLYFDKDGIVVESSSSQIENIPMIQGLEYNKIILHEKLEVQKDELFDVIINLTQLIHKYDLDVDTITFNKASEVTIDCGGIKVLLGKKRTYDEALSELKNIMAEAEGMDIIIDMSNYVKGTDHIIAKPKKATE